MASTLTEFAAGPAQAVPSPGLGPILIVGYIHTGTTLLKRVLSSEPSLLTIIGESHFFQDINRIRRQYPDLHDEATIRRFVDYLVKLCRLGFRRATWHQDDYDRRELGVDDDLYERMVALATGQPTHETVYRLVLDQLASGFGKERWLMKSPENVYFVSEILAAWPDIKVVELVRDPRAALSSRKIRQTEDEWFEQKEERENLATDRATNYDTFLDAYMWKEAIHAADDAKRSHPGSVLPVRYEDLVTEPEATIRRICDFANLDFHDEMLNVGWINSATQYRDAETNGGGISAKAVDEWKQRLTPEEVAACQMVLHAEMDRYAYALAPVSARARLKTPLLAGRTAAHLLNRLVADRPPGLERRSREMSGRLYRRLMRNLGLQK